MNLLRVKEPVVLCLDGVSKLRADSRGEEREEKKEEEKFLVRRTMEEIKARCMPTDVPAHQAISLFLFRSFSSLSLDSFLRSTQWRILDKTRPREEPITPWIDGVCTFGNIRQTHACSDSEGKWIRASSPLKSSHR